MRVSRKHDGAQEGMTVEDFEENVAVIERYNKPLTIAEEFDRAMFDPKYHGLKKPGCCLVKHHREIVGNDPRFQTYADIFTCLRCGGECLRSGWEVGWYGGTYSPDLL